MIMANVPRFRTNDKGELLLQCSEEAVAAKNKFREENRNKIKPPRVLSPEEVERKARHAVLARGGNPNNRMEVLGEFSFQKFQYRGRSFKWALENDPAYVSYLIREEAPPNSGEGDTAKWNQNISYLKQYALRFPAFEKMHKLRCEQQAAKEAATKKGDPGLQVVGFGQFRGLTFKELASSTNHKHVKYIEEFLLPKRDIIPGSAMYRLCQYVVDQRKSQSAPSVALSAQAASSSQSLTNVSQKLSDCVNMLWTKENHSLLHQLH